ncbi:PDZ domain-containing protein [Lignipirellula cremea]|uniref:PDZ domain (Also known as DHR or GLGF) n=1 Tax=Lignipirellula cremea TaxID=2528010 RepID=A0A518DZF1_9BACT|nr:PDZ domain-containing protein [Lignipirellula cremea]QDU97227.1 PDZ domain (Also known as DHR or GLGF) [Lignipirellula cremea]
MSRYPIFTLALLLASLFLSAASAQAQNQPKLGFEGIENGRGIYVQQVEYASAAQQMGLEPGAVLLSINGVAVESHAHYLEVLRDAVTNHQGKVEIVAKNSRPYPAQITLSGVIDDNYMVSHADTTSH